MMIIMIIGSMYGGSRGAFRVFVRIPKGKRSLKRPRCRWENNIKLGLQEIGWEGVDWIDLAQDEDRRQAVVNAVMNLRVP